MDLERSFAHALVSILGYADVDLAYIKCIGNRDGGVFIDIRRDARTPLTLVILAPMELHLDQFCRFSCADAVSEVAKAKRRYGG